MGHVTIRSKPFFEENIVWAQCLPRAHVRRGGIGRLEKMAVTRR
jgi:hypothetical protein